MVGLASDALHEASAKPVLMRRILDTELVAVQPPVGLQAIENDVRVGRRRKNDSLSETARDRCSGKRADIGHAEVPHNSSVAKRSSQFEQLGFDLKPVLPCFAGWQWSIRADRQSFDTMAIADVLRCWLETIRARDSDDFGYRPLSRQRRPKRTKQGSHAARITNAQSRAHAIDARMHAWLHDDESTAGLRERVLVSETHSR